MSRGGTSETGLSRDPGDGTGDRVSTPQGPAAEGLTHWEGEPLRVWEALWGIPRLEAYGTIGSTNDRARALAREGAPAFASVLAEEQTAGRGREGRRWVSPPGKGVWLSTLLRPRLREAGGLAPILTGLAVCRAVEAAIPGLAARLKWPNDVVVEGRKVAGILCEATGGIVVAGLGINVGQSESDFPRDLRARAGSLRSVSGRDVRRPELVGRALRELRDLTDRPVLRLGGALAEEMARRDALRDREVVVSAGSDAFRGTARGVEPDGRLRVETARGVRKVAAGTVRPVDEA